MREQHGEVDRHGIVPGMHWREGMPLYPHYLQAHTLSLHSHLAAGNRLRGPWCWGVARLEVSISPTEPPGVFVAKALLVMPSGYLVRLGADAASNAALEPRSLNGFWPPDPLGLDARLGIRIGIPDERGVRAVADEANPRGRYRIKPERQLNDENRMDEDSAVEAERRVWNARIFLGDEDTAGYECVQICEIQQVGEANTSPVVCSDYVPPLLDVTENENLRALLRDLCGAIRDANKRLGGEVASRPFAWTLESGADPELIYKLNATNTELATIDQLCETRGVHPFDTYLALCRLIGALAIFSTNRRCPKIDPYDHNDIGGRFARVGKIIKEFLHYVDKKTFDRRTFAPTAASLQLSCELPERWIKESLKLYLAFEVSGAAAPVIEKWLGELPGRVKLVGQEGVDSVQGQVLPGVNFVRCVKTPRALPELTDVTYYAIDLVSSGDNRRVEFERAKSVFLLLPKPRTTRAEPGASAVVVPASEAEFKDFKAYLYAVLKG